jgi:hypothetical protein
MGQWKMPSPKECFLLIFGRKHREEHFLDREVLTGPVSTLKCPKRFACTSGIPL